jgi:5-methyltetrahydropteroyltriglutamate--homocysteine methyltransferase
MLTSFQEMVKWFDSNYHYVKPTLLKSQTFKLAANPKPVVEFLEAKEVGIQTRPVILGPVSFLSLAKADRGEDIEPITLLDKLLPVYVELLTKLKEAGAEDVQLDEPVLVFDLAPAIKDAYATLPKAFLGANMPRITVATYFGDIVHNIDAVSHLKDFHALHIDLVRNPEQLETVLGTVGPKQILSAGVVDGRNIWKTNFQRAIGIVETAIQKLGKDRVIVASSSSLLHTPHTLTSEKKLDPEVKDWFSFATEKAAELAIIANAVTDGPEAVRDHLEANAASIKRRAESKRTNDPKVKDRQEKVTEEMHNRKSPFPVRIAQQQKNLNLPMFPTTTIGSFPQTKEIRIQRNKFTKGAITADEYEKFIEKEIQDVIKIQDELDLDVYVHGEPERNDMVQYFGERLEGYVFTTHAWVQSYGSRCVRPPIVVGDISRPAPMTVKESKYAASISKKPMKGMLTGPITCLRWSFPRDDVHQSVQAQQLALALRDEVIDLEAAGIFVIQVDEPALREGLPLRAGIERQKYLSWAVKSFRLSTAGVQDSTQIHSHFCYSEFQDFFHAIAALDADVLSIENSKSDAKLLKVFVDEAYPRHIGPGVYDIHSPRVPSEQEIKDRIEEMLHYLKPDQLWIDPDCGLKTRQWKETKEALTNMVNAAKFFREKYSK